MPVQLPMWLGMLRFLGNWLSLALVFRQIKGHMDTGLQISKKLSRKFRSKRKAIALSANIKLRQDKDTTKKSDWEKYKATLNHLPVYTPWCK